MSPSNSPEATAATGSRNSGFARWLAGAVGLAAAYYVAGRLALLLAIPPGYATAIWPAAGIALAGILLLGFRVWPGIVAGSFLINVWTSLEPGDPASGVRAVLVAGAIGLGAAAQALGGAVLVRRLVGYPTALDDESTVVRFLVTAPLGCLVSGTVGVTALWGSGIIAGREFAFSWWTWWVGDTIGVVIVTPLVFLWVGEMREVRPARRLAVTLPLAAVAALAVVFFVYASLWEQGRIRREFERRTAIVLDAVRDAFDRPLEILHSIEGLAHVSGEVDERMFEAFLERLSTRHPTVLAVGWNERISRADRLAYEARRSRDAKRPFSITERSAPSVFVQAPDREEYVVVSRVYPLVPGNLKFPGFNTTSDPVRREALDRARDTGRAAASAPIVLGGGEFGHGLAVYLPVYRRHAARDSVAERRRSLLGYAVSVFDVSRVMTAVFRAVPIAATSVELYDATAGPRERLLYRQRVGAAGERDTELTQEHGFEVAGRSLTLRFAATRAYLHAERSWQAWAVLAGGLVLAALLEAFLLVVTGRAARVERLVDARTADLQREIAERARAQGALQESEARVRGLLESAPDAMVIVDRNGRIVLINSQTEKLFGYPREELLGQRVEALVPVRFRAAHPVHRARFFDNPSARRWVREWTSSPCARMARSFPRKSV